MQRKNEQLSPQEQKILVKKAEEFPELYGKPMVVIRNY